MNYLLAKRNLATFDPADITILAEYFNINADIDQDDLLWLLAIKIHSNKRAGMPPDGEKAEIVQQLLHPEVLSDDVLFEITSRLDLPDIAHLCQTSKAFNKRLCDNEKFWERLMKSKYPGFEKSKFITWGGLAMQLGTIQKHYKEKASYSLGEINQLEAAMLGNQLDVVKLLLEYGPTFEVERNVFYKVRNSEILQLVLDSPKVTYDGPKELFEYELKKHGHYRPNYILFDLLSKKITLNMNQIGKIAQGGDARLMAILLKNPHIGTSEINKAFRTAMNYANTDKAVGVLLRDEQVDPNMDNNWALKRALIYKSIDIVKLFLDNPRVQINKQILNKARENAVKSYSPKEAKEKLQLVENEYKKRFPEEDIKEGSVKELLDLREKLHDKEEEEPEEEEEEPEEEAEEESEEGEELGSEEEEESPKRSKWPRLKRVLFKK